MALSRLRQAPKRNLYFALAFAPFFLWLEFICLSNHWYLQAAGAVTAWIIFFFQVYLAAIRFRRGRPMAGCHCFTGQNLRRFSGRQSIISFTPYPFQIRR
jgi:hypothetical protein